LQESLKYWRARFCLIHLDVSGSKRLHAGGSSIYDRCDVFGFRNQYNHVLLIEGLMRFLETENKLKRVLLNSYSRRDALMNLVCLRYLLKTCFKPGSFQSRFQQVCRLLYPPSERSETDGYTVYSFVCLCVCLSHSVQSWRIYALSERLLV